MFDGRMDQAEGLRRMLSTDIPRSYALFGAKPGCGTTSCVMNLGAALAQAGHDVVLVDEHAGTSNISGKLGLAASPDTSQLLAGQQNTVAPQISLAPGLRLMKAAVNGVAAPSGMSGDIVLIDALTPLGEMNPRAGIPAHEVLVVMQTDASSITRAYSVMKRLRAQHGIGRFRVLVSHCSDAGAARRAVRNLTQAARGFLDAALDYAGAVPFDAAFEVAERNREPLLMSRPSAVAARAFRQLATDLAAQRAGLPLKRSDETDLSFTSNHRGRWLAATGG